MASTGIIESRPVRERPRVLRITRFVLLLVMTWTVIADTGRAIGTLTGRTIALFGSAPSDLPLTFLPQITRAEPAVGGTGSLADADLLLRILAAAPPLIHAVTVVLAVAWLLRAIRGVAQGQPFHGFVIVNWRRLAMTLLAGGLAQGCMDTVAYAYLTAHLGFIARSGTGTGADPTQSFLGSRYDEIATQLPAWPVDLLLAGLVALSLMAAFRAGARLAEDADGVV
ncbi:hypothetical protein [Clavibacter michiganensis]|uniref:hypothetical protein n=1 Tax=Clavibacter michiganensis TaxID=28447 RepID=UPI000A3A8466|nr:hypothetical protein [Clavibacter michiganensis]MBE3078406.1 hypothetical protein [Clavibacter michiganensis subsp. michiganensis]MDO4029425.1 hypothetical protein [Clavibacter michiganensis]MDO4041801.1 hypothetical protein [Clavibacter michiganensis]MDO4044700.1 hypothetical protein [Clavibacter michiganensis]MDO4054174.1 hypothetical protein [Clavibacter michiganensis]